MYRYIYTLIYIYTHIYRYIYSTNVTTDVGRQFLKLIDKCFPKGSKLNKIFNRNSLKVSYRTCPNMKQALSGHNSKVLKETNQKSQSQAQFKKCNCQKKSECPLNNECRHEQGVVYQATITQENGKIDTYIGSTKDFKERYGNHKKSFKNASYKTDTELSVFLWKLKSDNITYTQMESN